ncbi:rhodanese-like domain-containing protein 4, chloroplastic [Coffea eugenioides]|uniref:rhodanese-like domain-containing protein 4, chloroplastic n=1 Tax=Coffea eugenioides TaxID=49369 RepID=UPI000F60DDCD|nr:rhodanese-like domain-containing protein 4, chloroplastic [Coffea eugenioides]
MEALNAVGLTPLSVLSERRTEPRKYLPFHAVPQIKTCPTLANFRRDSAKVAGALPKTIGAGIVLLSSVLGSGSAEALSYEEALQQSLGEFPSLDLDAFDVSGVIDSVTNFVAENPLVVGGGVAILAVPLLLSQVFGKSKPWGVESAKAAYAKLNDDASAQLLDIRPPVELRRVGSPDVRGLKKKPVAVAYKGDDKLGFLKKLSLKFKEPENTTLFILDKFNGNSELVAELVTANGFKAAYAIRDGAEGSRGWMSSGLPWTLPKKFSLDLSNLTDTIGGTVGEADATSVILGIAAATGLGLLAFSEVETILQVLGSAALFQLIGQKFLFAEDRKKTLEKVDEFFTTKVAPKELVGDVKLIGKALLPLPVTSKALPAPTEANPGTIGSTTERVESVPGVSDAPSKVEAVAEPTAEINSVPKAEVETDSLPGISRPLSPYPNYPDLKPPASPMPAQP